MDDNTPDKSQITQISDTELWAAVYRALETKGIDEFHPQGYQRESSRLLR